MSLLIERSDNRPSTFDKGNATVFGHLCIVDKWIEVVQQPIFEPLGKVDGHGSLHDLHGAVADRLEVLKSVLRDRERCGVVIVVVEILFTEVSKPGNDELYRRRRTGFKRHLVAEYGPIAVPQNTVVEKPRGVGACRDR